MNTGHLIESYTFGDIVHRWARERLIHEILVARELAKGVVDEALQLQSINPKHLKSSASLRGEPYLGYSGQDRNKPVLLKAAAFRHLCEVSNGRVDASFDILRYELVTKADFRDWLVHTGRAMPAFWFAEDERFPKPSPVTG